MAALSFAIKSAYFRRLSIIALLLLLVGSSGLLPAYGLDDITDIGSRGVITYPSSTAQTDIGSRGVITYPSSTAQTAQTAQTAPTAPFTVNGKYVVDKYGRKTMLKGFEMDSGKMIYYPKGTRDTACYTRDDLERIKEWGIHFAYIEVWWGNVEDRETGAYDESHLFRYARYMDMSEELGIYWIFRFRVSYDDSDPPYWAGWGRHRYVCTDEGLQRYCNFLEWAIKKLEQRFPNVIVAYHPWQFPWHHGGASLSQQEYYYSKVIPAIVKASRKSTNKILMVSSCWTSSTDFSRLGKVDDNNIVYGFCYYKPEQHTGTEPIWYGSQSDIDYQWELVEKAEDFRNTHNVPLYAVEFGIRPEREDQINKLELKLQIMDYLEMGWCYWWYSWYADSSFCICYSDGTPKWGIMNKLMEYSEWEL